MIVSLVLAPPSPGSFNHAIAKAARDALQQKGHRLAFHDLHTEGFDPVLPTEEIPRGAALVTAIERHCEEIASGDGIVIVHLNWWGMPPAILKGWADRVLRPGVAYEFLDGDSGEGVPHGLLRPRPRSSLMPPTPLRIGSCASSATILSGSGRAASSICAESGSFTGRPTRGDDEHTLREGSLASGCQSQS